MRPIGLVNFFHTMFSFQDFSNSAQIGNKRQCNKNSDSSSFSFGSYLCLS